MDSGDQNPGTPLAARRDVLLAVWLTRTLEAYPTSSRNFLALEKDPFRNPVGHTLKEGLANLLDGVLGSGDFAEMVADLEPIVRLRAVQDFTPSQAVSFVFLLKGVLREQVSGLGDSALPQIRTLEERIDRLALAAFDLYMQCREEMVKIQVNAAKRSLFVPLHLGQKGAAPDEG